jgi:DNA-binding CsgD family transcriptional regulator
MGKLGLELTEREHRALILYADGYTSDQAAKAMGYSARGSYWWTIGIVRKKLGAKTNPHTIALAYHYGILKTPISN